MNILKEYFKDDKTFAENSDHVDQYFKTLEMIKESNGDNLNQYVKGERFKLPGELRNDFTEFIDLVQLLFRKIDYADYIKRMKENIGEDQFWDGIQKIFEKKSRSYYETDFIRSMNRETFESVINEVFNKHVLLHDRIKEMENLDYKQVLKVIKLLNTVISLVHEDLLSQEGFRRKASIMFDLDDARIAFLWSLVNQHKDDLRYMIMLRMMNRTQNLFQGILNAIEESDDLSEEEENK